MLRWGVTSNNGDKLQETSNAMDSYTQRTHEVGTMIGGREQPRMSRSKTSELDRGTSAAADKAWTSSLTQRRCLRNFWSGELLLIIKLSFNTNRVDSSPIRRTKSSQNSSILTMSPNDKIAIIGHNGWAASGIIKSLALQPFEQSIRILAREGSRTSDVPENTELVRYSWDDDASISQALEGVDVLL